jgi:hypothetical protein
VLKGRVMLIVLKVMILSIIVSECYSVIWLQSNTDNITKFDTFVDNVLSLQSQIYVLQV